MQDIIDFVLYQSETLEYGFCRQELVQKCLDFAIHYPCDSIDYKIKLAMEIYAGIIASHFHGLTEAQKEEFTLFQ